MYYEINVARNGEHFFATAERSILDAQKAATLLGDFKRRFPVSEGFNVTVSYHEHRIVDATELLLPAALLQNP